MYKIYKCFICFIFFTNIFYIVEAQDYNYGVSFREVWDHGYGSGGDIKFFIGKKTPKNNQAIDIVIHSLWHGIMITSMYEVHNPLYITKKMKGLYWYYGGGIHFGNFQISNGFCPKFVDKYGRLTKIGVDGIFGIEYELDRAAKHQKLPFIIGIDFKPYYDLYGAGCGGNWIVSASIGVVFTRLRGLKMIIKDK